MECPVCKQRMNHEKIESAWVDVCRDHGIWLDSGEIESIIEHSKKRGEGDAFVRGMWNYTHSH